MNQQPRNFYAFSSFRLDARERLLTCGGQPIPLASKTFDALLVLVQNAGHLVTKETLMKQLWPDTFVEEANLTKHISLLRKVLSGTTNGEDYIETIPKHGYRFVAAVAYGADAAAATAGGSCPSSPPQQSLPVGAEHRVARTTGRAWRLISVAAVVALILVGFAILVVKRQPSAPLELKQLQLTNNSSENAVVSAAISPDGRYLAYSDPKGIHIKLIETGETQTLPQPDDLKGFQVNWAIVPTWVRDGTRLIATANIPGQTLSVWVVPVIGAPPRKLRDDAFAYTISRDGSWVIFLTNRSSHGSRELWMMKPDGTQAKKLYDAGENGVFYGADWSPDGRRVGYVKEARPPFRSLPSGVADQAHITIESRDLEGGPPSLALSSGVEDWVWSPDWRIIYSLSEPGPSVDSCNFWEIQMNPDTGRPLEKPRRLTNWAGFCMDSPSATSDGKRLTYRRWSWHGNVYVADLETGGTRLSTLRRLTLNEGKNYPGAWTLDSKAVVFRSQDDGQWRIFKQHLDQEISEPIAVERGSDIAGGRVSADGAWILYVASPSNNDNSTEQPQLMRVPIRGGPAQFVLAAAIYGDPICARSPSTLCAFAKQTSDHTQLVFTSFDPVRGLGKEIIRFDTEAQADDDPEIRRYIWDLSPDGTRIAILRYSEGRISVLSLNGERQFEFTVKGWNNLLSVNWAADGKSLFVSSATRTGSALLHVNLRGYSHVLWEQKGSIAPWNGPYAQWLGGPSAPWAVPSPDGRHLAIYSWSLSANVWMMENF